jgi:hypothetical protein
MMKKHFEQRKTRPAPSKEKTTQKKSSIPFLPRCLSSLFLTINQSTSLSAAVPLNILPTERVFLYKRIPITHLSKQLQQRRASMLTRQKESGRFAAPLSV